MAVLRKLLGAVAVVGAVLAGNWLGSEIRSRMTGAPVQSVRFQHTTAEGKVMRNVPVVTKFYPALVIGLLGKPRWLNAFLGGIVTGGLIDERYERLLWQRLEKASLLRKGIGGKAAEVKLAGEIGPSQFPLPDNSLELTGL